MFIILKIIKTNTTRSTMSDFALYTNLCDHYGSKEPTEINYNKIRFPYFPSRVNATVPIGRITLKQFLESHKNPKPAIIEVFDKIQEATKAGDEKLKAELKQKNLYYFTPTVDLEYRNYDSIKTFNPLMVAEYDKIGEKTAIRLKKSIFKRFDSCMCAYLSPSKIGVKFIFRIPVVNSVEEYKTYFYGLSYYLSMIEGFDIINNNPTQPLFLSYDYDMLVRPQEETTEWTIRGYKLNDFKQFEGEIIEVEATQQDRNRVFNNIKRAVDKIEDNGHPQIVSAATSLGGFVTAGYLTAEEAEEHIHNLIENNDYLRKGVKGYKKTASQMIKRGMSSPLYLN